MSLLKARLRTAEAVSTPAPGGDPMPCMVCGASTPHKTLSTLGARCAPCFKAYCNAPQPTQKLYTGRRPGDAPRQFTMPEEP